MRETVLSFVVRFFSAGALVRMKVKNGFICIADETILAKKPHRGDITVARMGALFPIKNRVAVTL
jgi:hypothetical protein